MPEFVTDPIAIDDVIADFSMAMKCMERITDLDIMCSAAPDAQAWLNNNNWGQLQNFVLTLADDFLSWMEIASLNQKCFIYSRVDFEKDFENICIGLSIEAAEQGGLSRLGTILSYYRPTLLPNLRDYLARVEDVHAAAGSRQALEERALNPNHRVPLTEHEIETGKAVLKKSVDLMDSVLGPGMAEKFLAGEEFVFAGDKYSFSVCGSGHDHLERSIKVDVKGVPYQLNLRTLKGEQLASGCVYFQGLPVIDQVVSLYISIMAGDEKKILQTAHWTKRTPLFRDYVTADECPTLEIPPNAPHREQTYDFSPEHVAEAERILPDIKRYMLHALAGENDRACFRPGFVADRILQHCNAA